MGTFREALLDHPAPAALGDVRFSFDRSILLAETEPLGQGWTASFAGVIAVGAALACLAVLLTTKAPPWVSGVLAAETAAAAWCGRRLERRSRYRRRFVLHFALEQLRLEVPSPRGWTLRAAWIPFDQVREVTVRTGPGAARLTVEWERAPGLKENAVLIERIPDSELETLYRFRRTLAAAFGLTGEGLP